MGYRHRENVCRDEGGELNNFFWGAETPTYVFPIEGLPLGTKRLPT